MSGQTYHVVENSRGWTVTIYKHNAYVRERVAEIIGRPVARKDFPTGQPVFIPRTTTEESNA